MNIIPCPKEIIVEDIFTDSIESSETAYSNCGPSLLDYLNKKLDKEIKYENKYLYKYLFIGSNKINFDTIVLKPEIKEKSEGYELTLNSEGLLIISSTDEGLFYGFQTYRQLVEQHCKKEVRIIDWPDNAIRGFHLELRYAMPRFERILEIIDEIALFKFNTLLMEYENRFPYNKYSDIRSNHAFTEEELKTMLSYAKERFVEIIPLQQTLGHLEYILKKDKYNHLREVKEDDIVTELPFSFNGVGFKHFNDIDEICATNEEAYKLIEELCSEVISSHPQSKYIHIGCDEAWNLLTCSSCIDRYGKDGARKLYIDHINRMAALVREAGKTPIIWDDMLRHFEKEDFELLDKNIILMCWLYFRSDYQKGSELIRKYKDAGFEVIGASAAKCSEGVNPLYLDMPYMEERLGNIEIWGRLSKEFQLPGVITTLWSNYTGTIAPPHPFFDTAWYPVIFSAEEYWNSGTLKEEFYDKFMSNYFGVEVEKGALDNNNACSFRVFSFVAEKGERHKYLAEVYMVMALVSAYRIKSLAINREIYKLFSPTTEAEKRLVRKRLQEVISLRDYLKPMIKKVLVRNYREEDIEEFINSRFMLDEMIKDRIL